MIEYRAVIVLHTGDRLPYRTATDHNRDAVDHLYKEVKSAGKEGAFVTVNGGMEFYGPLQFRCVAVEMYEHEGETHG